MLLFDSCNTNISVLFMVDIHESQHRLRVKTPNVSSDPNDMSEKYWCMFVIKIVKCNVIVMQFV